DIGKGLILMINPEILTGFGEDQMEEGCLSLPDTTVNVRRKETLLVRYIDKYEKEKEREFKGLTARVIQHEIDHLHGIVFIDRMEDMSTFMTTEELERQFEKGRKKDA
ncbi:MAG: Peptide deformylase, partial [candidate division CPR3 bacterium GW2011_GWE2_35_7]